MPAISAITLSDIDEAERFATARDRASYLHLRSMVRNLGARYLGVRPVRVSFGRDAAGTWLQSDHRTFRYSAEAAGDTMVCVISLHAPIPLSLETIDESVAHTELAAGCLPADDAWQILVARGAERAEKFFRLWTRHEVDSRQPNRRVESFSPYPQVIGAIELPGEDWTLVQHFEDLPCHLAA